MSNNWRTHKKQNCCTNSLDVQGYDWVICHFHITSYLTKLCVFWSWTYLNCFLKKEISWCERSVEHVREMSVFLWCCLRALGSIATHGHLMFNFAHPPLPWVYIIYPHRVIWREKDFCWAYQFSGGRIIRSLLIIEPHENPFPIRNSAFQKYLGFYCTCRRDFESSWKFVWCNNWIPHSKTRTNIR